MLHDMCAFGHTRNTGGCRFKLPTLDEFMTAWNHLIRSSPASKLLWGDILATTPRSFANAPNGHERDLSRASPAGRIAGRNGRRPCSALGARQAQTAISP